MKLLDDSVSNLSLGEVLGSGSQGTVHKPAECLVDCQWYIKCHKNERHFSTEVSTMSSLLGVTGIVQLVAVDRANLAFVGSPVCMQMSCLRGKVRLFDMAVQLVDIFAAFHGRGIGHRDCRCGNFLVEVSENDQPVQAIIGDWATSVKLNEEQHIDYEGAVHFAADSVLKNLHDGRTKFAYTAEMDLESLVKTVWDLLRPTSCGVDQESKNDPGAILAWWIRQAGTNERLANYLKLARELNYAGLKDVWSK